MTARAELGSPERAQEEQRSSSEPWQVAARCSSLIQKAEEPQGSHSGKGSHPLIPHRTHEAAFWSGAGKVQGAVQPAGEAEPGQA